jgi:hypothetical protein
MIPAQITDTLASVAGEYAKEEGPFFAPIGELTGIPDDLLHLPTNIELPNMNSFQAQMVKTMLTEGGRTKLFANPVADAVASCQDKLNQLIQGEGVEPDLVSAATDLLQTMTFFKSHTDRLAGVVEPTSPTAQYPTLEKALAVGESMNYAHQLLDAVPTNAPALSLFSSFFSGKQTLTDLQQMLTNPTSSAISASDLAGISQSLSKNVENDVNNYTIGLKKLKRMGIGNMAFGSQAKQVGGAILDLIGTANTKAIFADNAANPTPEASEPSKRAPGEEFNRDFKVITDLLVHNGLFEGIPLTLALWNQLKDLYPSSQAGLLNAYLGAHSITTQSAIDTLFADPKERQTLMKTLWKDWVSRMNFGVRMADPYFYGTKIIGPVSWILLSSFNSVQRAFTSHTGWVVFDGNGNRRDFTTTEDDEVYAKMYGSNPRSATFPAYQFDQYGFFVGYGGYLSNFLDIVADNPTVPKAGMQYINGFWKTPAAAPVVWNGKDIVPPGRNEHAIVGPGEVLTWRLLTDFAGINITGGLIQFASEPGGYNPIGTMYEATISRTPGDFITPAARLITGPNGGTLGWAPDSPAPYIATVPRGEKWFLNFRLDPNNLGRISEGPGGKAGLTYFWSITSR